MEIKPLIKEDFVVLDEESTLSELIGKLKTFEKRTGLVFRKKKYSDKGSIYRKYYKTANDEGGWI